MTLLLETTVAPNFYELLDSEKKYRKRRNSIAHSGEVVSKKIYEEFKDKTFLALDEIESWLSAITAGKVE